jgi:hypothetical protein
MRSRLGRERRLVHPGQLVAWDPSNGHAGTTVDGRPWSARLLADVVFPEPVLSDLALTRRFLRLHGALETPSTRLERDQWLAEWLDELALRPGSARFASSVCFESGPACRGTRYSSPTAFSVRGVCSKQATRLRLLRPPPALPTKVTCTATSNARSA